MQGTLIEGCPDLITPVYQAIEREIKTYACRANWASEAGHPCIKYLVYLRTRWQEKLLHDAETEMLFRAGKIYEQKAYEYLTKAGFDVIEQSRPFDWSIYEISGKLDFKVRDFNNKLFPIEVKGLHPYYWDKLNCIEDFLESKKHWIKKYPAQLILYMLMDNSEFGCFYIINKLTFRPKQIWVSLDYSFGEDILKKLERVNKYVKENTIPDGINDPDICQYCGFLHICLPEMIGKEIEIIDEISIEEAIKRCEELKPLVSEYNKLDKQWKKSLEGKEKVIIGDFLITGKWIERKSYTVEAGKYWQSKILIKPKESLKGSEELC